MRKLPLLMLILAACGAVSAGGPEKGEREASFRLAFSDTDFGSSRFGGSTSFDLGSVESTETRLSWGYFVTERQEFGLLASYFEEDVKGGDLDPDVKTDGTAFGGFYTFNFPTGGSVTPYVGAAISKLGGDAGDFYDLEYGAEAGVKVYPYEHAGFSFGIGYFELKGDGDLPDADGLQLGGGLLFKY